MGNLRVKAAEYFLVHLPNENLTHEEQLNLLEEESVKGNGNNASYIDGVLVWEPFENETIDGLLEKIDDLETEYNKIWNEALMLGYKNGSGETTLKI